MLHLKSWEYDSRWDNVIAWFRHSAVMQLCSSSDSPLVGNDETAVLRNCITVEKRKWRLGVQTIPSMPTRRFCGVDNCLFFISHLLHLLHLLRYYFSFSLFHFLIFSSLCLSRNNREMEGRENEKNWNSNIVSVVSVVNEVYLFSYFIYSINVTYSFTAKSKY